jgi:hypothetical protein
MLYNYIVWAEKGGMIPPVFLSLGPASKVHAALVVVDARVEPEHDEGEVRRRGKV